MIEKKTLLKPERNKIMQKVTGTRRFINRQLSELKLWAEKEYKGDIEVLYKMFNYIGRVLPAAQVKFYGEFNTITIEDMFLYVENNGNIIAISDKWDINLLLESIYAIQHPVEYPMEDCR